MLVDGIQEPGRENPNAVRIHLRQKNLYLRVLRLYVSEFVRSLGCELEPETVLF